jgi:hypothetical protein
MALEVTRICDKCKNRLEQIIGPKEEAVTCEVAFICSDCVWRKSRELAALQHDRDVINSLPDESPAP